MPNDLVEKDLFDLADEENVAETNSQPYMKLKSKEPQMVTCLGKTFASEEERRTYFRDELRTKLPELKKLEGFPIGEDEDIINLSDPPYYTACPNPWLNDFIQEWETEKLDLEAKKKRKADHEVHEPYASDVSEGKNNPIYNAHSYHTKVPHPAIMRYILHYTQPGDIVLDGFAGTGMTGVAAQLCGSPDHELKFKIELEFEQNGLKAPVWGTRKAICGDLSPIASFIAYNYNTTVDVDAFEREAKRILSEVEKECGWMYETNHVDPKTGNPTGIKGRINYTVWSDVFVCSNCGQELVFWDAAVDKEKGEVLDEFPCPHCHAQQTKRGMNKSMVTIFDQALNETLRQAKTVPVLINYTAGGKRYEKSPDATDFALIQRIEAEPIPFWYPIDRMIEGGESRRNDDAGITHVHHFHIRSCLIGLALFWNKALAVPNTRIANALLLSASAANPNFSRLRRFRTGKKGGGPLAGTLYVASIITPQNPIESIRRNIEFVRKGLVSAGLKNQAGLTQVTSAGKNLLSGNSVDYIFTDPPFGANIMYSELNFLWESWLKVKTENRLEAIENSTQGKTLFDYQVLMLRCFQEYFRVLKPGRWMTVEFSNTGAAVWNGIQTALQRAGFVIANVAALDKQQGSFKAVTTPTAVKQDLVISCYKPSHEFDERFKVQSGEVNVWDFIAEHLTHLPVTIIKEKATTAVIERSPKILYDRLISFYLMRNMPVPIDAADFQIKLKQKFREADGMAFTAEQLAQYETQKKKLGITSQLAFTFDAIYSESEAIAWLKDKLEKAPTKRQDLYTDFRKANATTRKGEKELELSILLEENFIEEADGTWRVPDHNEAKDREILRTKALLKEFSTYLVAIDSPKPKKLKDVRLEALRAGFKNLWEKKDFAVLVKVADFIPQNLLMEDEMLLTYYDIAKDRV